MNPQEAQFWSEVSGSAEPRHPAIMLVFTSRSHTHKLTHTHTCTKIPAQNQELCENQLLAIKAESPGFDKPTDFNRLKQTLKHSARSQCISEGMPECHEEVPICWLWGRLMSFKGPSGKSLKWAKEVVLQTDCSSKGATKTHSEQI